MKKTKLYILILLAGITSPLLAEVASPSISPRQPLTFNNMGAYGGWNPYWLSDECLFDYFIVQAWTNPDKKETSSHGMTTKNWGNWLKRAAAQGKRVIAVVTPVGRKEGTDEVAHFKAALDTFMQQVDQSLLYCIVLHEENIYWNGKLEVLRELYAYAKQKYRVPVYQWYSPWAGASHRANRASSEGSHRHHNLRRQAKLDGRKGVAQVGHGVVVFV